MYLAHFGLRQRPFRATPDKDAYYPATSHESALARLQAALEQDEGLTLLSGEPGLGKTLVCHRLLEKAGEGTCCVFLTNSHVGDRAGLYQAILYDLSLPYSGGEQELRLALTDHLLKSFAAGRRNWIFVDEAQHLSADLLEELRLLGNLEARHSKAVQVILSAQPGIEGKLGLPELASLSQRLMVRAVLDPLGVHESADYLMHQLRQAGGRPERIMLDEALEVMARGGRGVPRLLNQAGHLALGLAHEMGLAQVDVEVALEALSQLGLEAAAAEEQQDLAVVCQGEGGEELPTADEDSEARGEEEAEGEYAAPRRPA